MGAAVKGAAGRVMDCAGLGAKGAGVWAMDEDDATAWTGVVGAIEAPFFKGTLRTIGLFTVVGVGAPGFGPAAGTEDAPGL